MYATLADYRTRASEVAAIDVIFDAPPKVKRKGGQAKLELERHFTDMYAVFLHKLSAFALQREASKKEKERLQVFFEELLKAKDALGRG